MLVSCIDLSKLAIGVSGNGCLSVLSRLLPFDSWNRLQQTPATQSVDKQAQKTNGWVLPEKTTFPDV